MTTTNSPHERAPRARLWAAAAAVVLSAGAGYAVGISGAATSSDAGRARAEAYAQALHQPKPLAETAARKRGVADGIRPGRTVGLRHGPHAGTKAAKRANTSLTREIAR
ncbi:MAG: hypothetical protein QOF65_2331 [Thermoleophilaceae bacterium]|nr:hypothetical protein [Thermoleophilaceae bacterium]